MRVDVEVVLRIETEIVTGIETENGIGKGLEIETVEESVMEEEGMTVSGMDEREAEIITVSATEAGPVRPFGVVTGGHRFAHISEFC